MGNPETVQEFLDMVSRWQPKLIFVMEIKVSREKIDPILERLKFDGMYFVSGQNNGGGIALMWRQENSTKLLGYNSNYIDVEVHLEDMKAWRFTGFYGYPESTRRKDSWNLIRKIATVSNLPWVCGGDFNDILSQSERQGPHCRPPYLIDGFNKVINDCGLNDLGMKGGDFTWERGRGTSDFVLQKLDRFFGSSMWINIFTDYEIHKISTIHSDHSAIVMVYGHADTLGKYIFRFENSWRWEPDCKQMVEKGWNDMQQMDIIDRINHCGETLASWGYKVKNRFKEEIKNCKHMIELHEQNFSTKSQQIVIEERKKLKQLYNQKAEFWRQRSKLLWLKAEDSNSKIFHNYASARQRKNSFKSLKDDHGVRRDWKNGLPDLIQAYFEDLFTSRGSDADEIINTVPNRISADQNTLLVRPFSNEEVDLAVKSMHPDKSPGPDGLNPCFYQSYWTVVGPKVRQACLNSLNNCQLPSNLNNTTIVLIPKIKKPDSISDLRPISLCNVIIRIMTKMMANRLKEVLNSVISETQSAFIPGRLITDNVLIAFETTHYLKRKNRGKDGVASLKIDMSKAYDRVEWRFLENMLVKLGFDDRWIRLVMLFVTTVRYTVRQNGMEIGPILPSRGLRQGDPISPYLFLICAEGLSCMLNNKARQGHIYGCRITRNAPKITHLFFADDSFLFFRASIQESEVIKQCLFSYELASGQKVNFSKSSILFSTNTSATTRHHVCFNLGVRSTDHGKYLGAPSLIGRNKVDVFNFLKEKVKKRMFGWNKKKLSRAGKEVLIKSVVQAVPSYIMSVFLIPISICDELERLMNSFWWGMKKDGSKGLCWKSWNKLCASKSFGGLGFRKLHEFNLAMLGKQGWRLMSNPTSLAARIMKSRYYPDRDFLQAKIGTNPSYAWRSIHATLDLLNSGVRHRVGSGLSINIWKDAWIPDLFNPFVETECEDGLEDATVNCLLKNDIKEWDHEIIRSLFSRRDCQKILSIPLSAQQYEDKLYWAWSRNGIYSVKSAYSQLFEIKNRGLGPVVIPWNSVWEQDIPPKVCNFLWRSLAGSLPSRIALANKSIDIATVCPVCHQFAESDFHALIDCSAAKRVWSLSPIGDNSVKFSKLTEWWLDVCKNKSKEQRTIAASLLWSIWTARNKLIWEGKNLNFAGIIANAQLMMQQWKGMTQHQRTTPRQQQINPEKWKKPAPGRLKLNVDAGCHNPNFSAYGGILRNEEGTFVAAIQGACKGNHEPFLAEALGMREALSWIKRNQFANVDIETDSQILALAIKNKEQNYSIAGMIIEDCVSLLTGLTSCTVTFVRRSANLVADALAKAVSSDSGQLELFDAPIFISDVLNKDLL